MADKTITNTELSQEKGTVKKQSRFFAVIKRMMKSPSAAIGTILFAIILLCAIFGTKQSRVGNRGSKQRRYNNQYENR